MSSCLQNNKNYIFPIQHKRKTSERRSEAYNYSIIYSVRISVKITFISQPSDHMVRNTKYSYITNNDG